MMPFKLLASTLLKEFSPFLMDGSHLLQDSGLDFVPSWDLEGRQASSPTQTAQAPTGFHQAPGDIYSGVAATMMDSSLFSPTAGPSDLAPERSVRKVWIEACGSSLRSDGATVNK